MAATLILTDALKEYCQSVLFDAAKAAPAAWARIALGWKAEPAVGLFTTWGKKASAFAGSIAMAVTCGGLARDHASTAGWATLIVVAVAFNAQSVASKAIVLSDPLLRGIAKRLRKGAEKRFREDE